MKAKKYMLLLLTIFFINIGSVYAADYGSGFTGLSKSKMQKIELRKAFDVPKINGYNAVQGMTITDKYFIIAHLSTDDNAIIEVYDRSTYKLVKTVKNLKLGHSNDFTYNPKTNKIYCAQANDAKTLAVLNVDTLKEEREITLDHCSSGIAYDTKKDRYLVTCGNNAYFYDSNFKYLNIRLNISTKLTRQNVGYYDGHYYRVAWEAGKVTQYQSEYEGILARNDNLVYIFDEKANLKNTFYVPSSNVYGEMESVSFRNGVPFFLYNVGGAHAVYYPKWDSLTKKLTLKVTSDDLDVSKITNKATLYDSDGKSLGTKSIADGKYTFDEITYKIRGTFNYTIKTDSTNVNIDKSSVDASIKITYDTLHNKLVMDTYNEPTIKINSINNVVNTPTPTTKPTTNPTTSPTTNPTTAPTTNPTTSPNQNNNEEDMVNPQTGVTPLIFLLLLAGVSIALANYNKKILDNN